MCHRLRRRHHTHRRDSGTARKVTTVRALRATCMLWAEHAPRTAGVVAGAAVVIALVAACGAATSGGGATQSGSPSSSAAPPLDACVAPGAGAREVVFSASGEQVVGAEFGSGTTGVVLTHEHGANLCGWVPYAQQLRDLGYRALAIDFGTHLAADVGGAAGELRHEGATRIVLMGASMGGTASLVAAASAATPVAGVAALSAPSEFMGLDGLAAASHLTIPVLFMAAQDNGEFPGDARAMYGACPSAHKQLQILGGSDHGTALLRYSVAGQAQTLLDSFVASTGA